jgi:hypothetical protein
LLTRRDFARRVRRLVQHGTKPADTETASS